MNIEKLKKQFTNKNSLFQNNLRQSRMPSLLIEAAKVGLPAEHEDSRSFWLGCVGIRKDGAKVMGKNGAVYSTQTENYQLLPGSHAEGRVIRKLGHGGTVYVARISKHDFGLTMGRPCSICSIRLASFKVERAYYTIDNFHYGIFYPKTGKDKIFRI